MNLAPCKLCGISEPIDELSDGVCSHCIESPPSAFEGRLADAGVFELIDDLKLEKKEDLKLQEREEPENAETSNPYLLYGFIEFAILSTLMVVFFPWSLLYCVIFYGIQETKLIVIALIHDAIKTFFAVLAVVLCVAVPIVFILISLLSS